MIRQSGSPARTVVLAIFTVFVASSAACATQTIFDNFAPGDEYDTQFAFAVGGSSPNSETAMSFTPNGTFFLEQIDTALSLIMGTNTVDLRLVNDDGGVPGTTVLEAWTFMDEMGSAGTLNPPLVATSVVSPILEADTPYWVVASASDSALVEWSFNSVGDMGPNAQRNDLGPWVTDDDFRGAFRVTGLPVPEPTSLSLLAGVGGLLLGRRRRRLVRAL